VHHPPQHGGTLKRDAVVPVMADSDYLIRVVLGEKNL
jgi:hypothetical protein